MRIEPSAEAYRAVLNAGLWYKIGSVVRRKNYHSFIASLLEAVDLPKEKVEAKIRCLGERRLDKTLRQILSIKLREHREGSYLPRAIDTGMITKLLLGDGYEKQVEEPSHAGSVLISIPYGHNAIFACAASKLYDLDHQIACSLWVGDANFRLRREGRGALVERLDLSEKGIWKTIFPESGLMRQEHFDAPDLSNSNGFCNSQTEKSALEEALRVYFSDLPKHP